MQIDIKICSSTSPLITHLKSKHPEEYEKLYSEDDKQQKKLPFNKQISKEELTFRFLIYIIRDYKSFKTVKSRNST